MTTSLLLSVFDAACLAPARQAWPVAETTLSIGENDRGEKPPAAAIGRGGSHCRLHVRGCPPHTPFFPGVARVPGACARLGSARQAKPISQEVCEDGSHRCHGNRGARSIAGLTPPRRR